MKDLILFGIQGAGKGTQGEMLIDKYGYKRFGSGSILRELARGDLEEANVIKYLIDRGFLVPDDIVFELLDKFMSSIRPDQPILYDGIPRTRRQYKRLIEHLKNQGRDYRAVVIQVSEDEAIHRLTSRKVCLNCKRNYSYFHNTDVCEVCHGPLVVRKDDQNTEVVNKRLEIYKEETLPIMENFIRDDKLIAINGERSISDIATDLEQQLINFHVFE